MQHCPECEMGMAAEADTCPACGSQASLSGGSAKQADGERLVADGGTPAESDGMSRRKLLLGGGTVVAAGGGAAGVLLLSGEIGGSPPPEGSPRKTALAFDEALHRHDLEEAESMLHPDSPTQEIHPMMAPMSSSNLESSVDSARVVQRNATHARVSVEVIWRHDDRGVVDRRNHTVLLEAHEGEWLVIPRMR